MRKVLFIFLVMIVGMPLVAGANILRFDNFTWDALFFGSYFYSPQELYDYILQNQPLQTIQIPPHNGT